MTSDVSPRGDAIPRRRRLLGHGAIGCGAIGGGVLVCVGAGLPWLRIGRTDRSAYALARTAQNLDRVRGVAPRAIVVALFCGPAFVGLALVLASLGRWRLAGCVSALVAVVGVFGGGAALHVSSQPRPGPIVSLGGGLLGLVAVAGMVRNRRPVRHTAGSGS